MPKLRLLTVWVAVGALSLGFWGAQKGFAGGYCSDLRLTCENGQTYPLCPIAVSEQGELVTAHLALGRSRGVHVRLVPMGVGYRYIGPGVWFDGLRGDATLFLGKDTALACRVEAD